MKNKSFTFLFGIAAFLVHGTTFASVDCPAAKVNYLQIEGSVIYVNLEGQNWHLLGQIDTVGTKERYSALLAAQMSGKKVVLRYPDGYDCSAYELTVPAMMVRTYNN